MYNHPSMDRPWMGDGKLVVKVTREYNVPSVIHGSSMDGGRLTDGCRWSSMDWRREYIPLMW